MTEPTDEQPWLSTGQPATIGVWRQLAVDMWGPDCPAVEFLDMARELFVATFDTPVYMAENEALDMLRNINRRTDTT